MRRLSILALALFMGSCATPQPDPIPVVEWPTKAPEIYRNLDGTSTVCIKRPIRRLDGSVDRIEEFCQ